MRLRDRKGFTLVELIMAMAISLVVLAAIFTLYVYFIRTSTGQERLIEIQQESRAAIERLSKEIRAAGCYYRNAPILVATVDNLQFESDLDPDPALGPWTVDYSLDTGARELLRRDAAWTGAAYGAFTAGQAMAGHITALSFRYFDENGAEIPSPIVSQANRDLIRRVTITLTAQTDAINPATGQVDTVTIDTSIQLRCMGVQQSTDTTPCALPTNAASSDPGTCGRLNLSWTASASADAAGYRLYYRPAGASFYTGTVDIPGGATQSYTLTGLDDGVAYELAMRCLDTSGNLNATFAAVGGDTTPNDAAAPANPTAVDANAGDGFVALTWTKSVSPDVGGYYVYRSDDSGATYSRVVELDSTYAAYTNDKTTDTTMLNCPAAAYRYKVVARDCAQTDARTNAALVLASAVFGDAAGTAADQPVSGVTDTLPTETTAPADPTNLDAVAGADRIYLSYATPVDADLKGVRILRRTDQFPADAQDSSAVGPNNQSDYEPLVQSQTYALVDSLNVFTGTTYYYRAFAYDGCLNYSAGATSFATARPCGDGVAGSKHFGPPSAPAAVTPAACSTASLAWTASAGSENGNLFDAPAEKDVVGYYVERGTASGGPYVRLNGSPVTSQSYSDAGVAAGNTYYYVVKAVDCADKESTIASPEARVKPADITWNNSGATPVTTTCCSINSATSSIDTGTSGSQHNIVRLYVKNLGDTQVTLNSMTASWTTATAYLKRVMLAPQGGVAKVLYEDSSLPFAASGAMVDLSAVQTAGFRTLGQLSDTNLLTLEFRDSADAASVDMRGASLNITLDYTNLDSGSACSSSTFSAAVPLGPVISSTTQNKPVEPTTSNINAGAIAVAYGTQDATTYAWTANTVLVGATVTPEAGTSLSGVKLYYAKTGRGTATPPSSDYRLVPSPAATWTSIALNNVAGDTYQTASAMTVSPGTRFWYYLRADDSNANYDLQPEPVVGVYTFDVDYKFNVYMYAGRFKDKCLGDWGTPGRYLTEYVYLTGSYYDNATKTVLTVPVTGASAAITVTGSGGTVLDTTTMTELTGSSGWYYYCNSSKDYTGKELKVSVRATKANYTAADCKQNDVKDNITAWDTKTCL